MEALKDEQYKKDYDEAAKKLDEAANATPESITKEEVKNEEVKTEDVKADADTQEVKTEEVESEKSLEELKKELEVERKRVKDTQAWGSKNAEELAKIKREQQLLEREREKPEILVKHPELETAFEYMAKDPLPQLKEEQDNQERLSIIAAAHPDIFTDDIDKDLEDNVLKRIDALGDSKTDPLLVIREITNAKIEHTEHKISKRFAIESEKLKDKSAMSIPSTGTSPQRTPVDKDLQEKNRILQMSDADFAKEVARVKGF